MRAIIPATNLKQDRSSCKKVGWAVFLPTINAATIFLEENGVDGLIQALQYLAKAKGMSQIAKETGLNRQSLYRTLTAEGKPKFETIDKIVHVLGFKLTIEPI